MQPSTVCRNREAEESIERKAEEQQSSSELASTSLNMGSKRMVNAIIRTGRRTSFVNNSLVCIIKILQMKSVPLMIMFLKTDVSRSIQAIIVARNRRYFS